MKSLANLSKTGIVLLILIGTTIIAGSVIYVTKLNDVKSGPVITVYKSPTCGCCKKWITHLENNGFQVKSNDLRNMDSIKQQVGVANRYQSCHTALVDGYYIEGHVPAADIRKILQSRPAAKGLSVPGMPVGSPGMEGARQDPYDVLLIRKDNSADVYTQYR